MLTRQAKGVLMLDFDPFGARQGKAEILMRRIAEMDGSIEVSAHEWTGVFQVNIRFWCHEIVRSSRCSMAGCVNFTAVIRVYAQNELYSTTRARKAPFLHGGLAPPNESAKPAE